MDNICFKLTCITNNNILFILKPYLIELTTSDSQNIEFDFKSLINNNDLSFSSNYIKISIIKNCKNYIILQLSLINKPPYYSYKYLSYYSNTITNSLAYKLSEITNEIYVLEKINSPLIKNYFYNNENFCYQKIIHP